MPEPTDGDEPLLPDEADDEYAVRLYLELVARGFYDPNTGEPVIWEPKQLIVTKQNEHTARRIMTATNNRTNVGGYATSGNLVGVDAPNTLSNYQIITSRYLAFRMATDTTWYLGDVTRAVKYMQNWPLEVTQAPPNSQKEFENDIVMQFKASRKGEYVVVEPRVITKCTVA